MKTHPKRVSGWELVMRGRLVGIALIGIVSGCDQGQQQTPAAKLDLGLPPAGSTEGLHLPGLDNDPALASAPSSPSDPETDRALEQLNTQVAWDNYFAAAEARRQQAMKDDANASDERSRENRRYEDRRYEKIRQEKLYWEKKQQQATETNNYYAKQVEANVQTKIGDDNAAKMKVEQNRQADAAAEKRRLQALMDAAAIERRRQQALIDASRR